MSDPILTNIGLSIVVKADVHDVPQVSTMLTISELAKAACPHCGSDPQWSTVNHASISWAEAKARIEKLLP